MLIATLVHCNWGLSACFVYLRTMFVCTVFSWNWTILLGLVTGGSTYFLIKYARVWTSKFFFLERNYTRDS